MKLKKLSLLAITAISLAIASCDKEDSQSIQSDENQVTISDDTNAGIQQFINQINGVATRSPLPDPNDPRWESYLREFVAADKECRTGKGSCLPDVIITPDGPGSIVPTRPGVWAQTSQGQQLQQMVDNKQVTLKRETNRSTNTEYYIYNGVEDNKVEIVVPVAYK